VTSPPYWGLRSYLTKDHPDKAREIGQEKTPEAYVETMVQVFREVRRCLHDSGTLWLNIGDSYSGGDRKFEPPQSLHGGEQRGTPDISVPNRNMGSHPSIKPKDLCMIPWRVALALQADGWWLRSVICWHKKSCMPESVTDRPTNSWEPIFLFAKSQRYFYDSFAVREFNTEAVMPYSVGDETPDLFGNSDAEVASEEQGAGLGESAKVSEQSTRQGGTCGVSQDGSNEAGAGTMAEVTGRAGVSQTVSQERQAQGGTEAVLRQREVSRVNQTLAENTEGARESATGLPQAQEQAQGCNLRPDGGTVAGNPSTAESPLPDVRPEEAPDTRPHCSVGERRTPHGEQHSSVVPKLQRTQGRPKNIIGNMSERGVTRTTEGLNLKTQAEKCSPDGSRNLRNVWTLGPEPYSEAHFATFPTEIPRRAILAGTSARGCCQTCLSPWERITERDKPKSRKVVTDTPPGQKPHSSFGVERVDSYPPTRAISWRQTCKCDGIDRRIVASPTGCRGGDDPSLVTGRAGMNRPRGDDEGQQPITRHEQSQYAAQLKASPRRAEMEAAAGKPFAHYLRTDDNGARPIPGGFLAEWIEKGWLTKVEVPDVVPGFEPIPCTVLDPFGGSGTTGSVAIELGRSAVLCELNDAYIPLIEKRTNITQGLRLH
jgi:DNA methylase